MTQTFLAWPNDGWLLWAEGQLTQTPLLAWTNDRWTLSSVFVDQTGVSYSVYLRFSLVSSASSALRICLADFTDFIPIFAPFFTRFWNGLNES